MAFDKVKHEFSGTLFNPSVGNVDMYLLNRESDGDTIGALSVRQGDLVTAHKFEIGYNYHDELVQMVVEQHRAIDTLLAARITQDGRSFPSKSVVWPTVAKASALMKKLGVTP